MSSFLGFLGKKKKHETGDVQYRNLPEQIPSNVKRCEKVISEKHKFIWLFVPKVGGRSLKSVLIDSYGGYVAEKGMDELVNEKPEYATYFRFNFVRNPWSRIVSCYANKIDTDDPKNLGACVVPYPGLYPHMPFEEFVHFLGTDAGSDFYQKANRHWVSQYVFCTDIFGSIFCDAIGKIENMQDDFAEICKKNRMPVCEVPHVGQTKPREEGDTERYRKFYTDETRELVRLRYARDIELFGYDF